MQAIGLVIDLALGAIRRKQRNSAQTAQLGANVAIGAFRRIPTQSAHSSAFSSSRSPAISLQLSVRKINKAGQKLTMLLLPSTQLLFWRETTNLAPIDVLLCAHPEFCAHFGTVLGLLYIHISHIRIDLTDAILFFLRLGSWPKLVANNRIRPWTDGAPLILKSDLL